MRKTHSSFTWGSYHLDGAILQGGEGCFSHIFAGFDGKLFIFLCESDKTVNFRMMELNQGVLAHFCARLGLNDKKVIVTG